ncbi:MAG: penicillin-binding protein activator LpoB [Deltaproteobacteria bacterium]
MRQTLLVVLVGTLAVGCATTKVSRLDTNDVKDVSGRWNDTDSRLVAEEMIADALSDPWLPKATKGGKLPVVTVQGVKNSSMEHINTQTFIEDLQRSLIKSGKVSFVASMDERAGIRDERQDQDMNASDATRKGQGKEIGADFVLSGVLNSIEDRSGGTSVIMYQVNLKLLNVKTNQIAWNGQKKIKKQIDRASTGW